jgi:hypothetical protein
MIARIKHDPAVAVGVVLALLGLATAFGLNVTSGQHDAIVGFVWAVLSLAGAAVTRSQVTPASEVVARIQPAEVGTDVDVVAGPAHPAPTGTPVELPPAV